MPVVLVIAPRIVIGIASAQIPGVTERLEVFISRGGALRGASTPPASPSDWRLASPAL